MASKDDLAPLVTACPNCDTRFRVTESQLQVAKGQVRCGACLHVFDGTSQLIQDGEALGGSADEDVDALLEEIDEQSAQSSSFASADEVDPANPLGSSVEDLLEKDPIEQDLEGFENAVPTAVSGETEDMTDPSVGLSIDDISERQLDSDLETGPNDAFSQDDARDEDKLLDLPHNPEADARLKALEDELMADLKGVLSTTDATPSEVDLLALDPDPESEAQDKEEFVPEAIEAVLEEPSEHSSESEFANEEQSNSGHVEIELTPVEPDPPPIQEIPAELLQDDEVPKRGWGTWLVMLLAVIALPAQVLWFQYDDWVKDDTMRPVYAVICDVAGCELPVRRNVGLIVAKQSVLRDHPEQEGALIFDALLVNHASYPQSFPIVELSLINMDRFVVASGRFEPKEYLAGEALNAQLMDPRTPIHISLELKKPDQETPNFRIRFIPAS